jgi:cytochrome c-type biogenesis protein CcmH/NrfG
MVEYRSEQEKFQASGPGMSELVRKDAEEKINGLATRIQSFQQQAQESLQADESKLIEPIITKAKKAIEQNPSDSTALNYLVIVYTQLNDAENIAKYKALSIKIDPFNPNLK